jgi:hypothetical protein
LKNVGFFNVKTAITDDVKNQVLLAGGDEVLKDAWGFGRVCRVFGIERGNDAVWRICNDGIGQNERANTLTGTLSAARLI